MTSVFQLRFHCSLRRRRARGGGRPDPLLRRRRVPRLRVNCAHRESLLMFRALQPRPPRGELLIGQLLLPRSRPAAEGKPLTPPRRTGIPGMDSAYRPLRSLAGRGQALLPGTGVPVSAFDVVRQPQDVRRAEPLLDDRLHQVASCPHVVSAVTPAGVTAGPVSRAGVIPGPVSRAGVIRLRMIHSATPTLITHPAAISSALLSPSGFPTKSNQGTLVRTCVPAPRAIAYPRIIQARCRAMSRRRIAAKPRTRETTMAVPNTSRKPLSSSPSPGASG